MSDPRAAGQEEDDDAELQAFFDAARDAPTPGEVARMRRNLQAAIEAETKKDARKRVAKAAGGALLAAASLAGVVVLVGALLRDPIRNAGAPNVKLPASSEPAGPPDAGTPASTGTPGPTHAPRRRTPRN